jgi:hypothetical protein
MITADLKKLEELGWRYSITSPNEGEWCKFEKSGCLIARQGSATWRMDLDKCMPGLLKRKRAHLYIHFEADLLDEGQKTAEAWGTWVLGRLIVPGINIADGSGRCTAKVTIHSVTDAHPSDIDVRDGRPGGAVYDERQAGEMGAGDVGVLRNDPWGRFARSGESHD